MPTTAVIITSEWTKVAEGPCSILTPALQRFTFALTAGPPPGISPSICPSRESGEELSCQLLDGESLYIAADQRFATSVTEWRGSGTSSPVEPTAPVSTISAATIITSTTLIEGAA